MRSEMCQGDGAREEGEVSMRGSRIDWKHMHLLRRDTHAKPCVRAVQHCTLSNACDRRPQRGARPSASPCA